MCCLLWPMQTLEKNASILKMRVGKGKISLHKVLRLLCQWEFWKHCFAENSYPKTFVCSLESKACARQERGDQTCELAEPWLSSWRKKNSYIMGAGQSGSWMWACLLKGWHVYCGICAVLTMLTEIVVAKYFACLLKV